MTVAVASGFAILALMSGFGLNRLLNSSNSLVDKINKSSASSAIKDEINNIENVQKYNTGITDYPYSEEYPNYTGATYLYDDWFLMANGKYFNRVSHKWSNNKPEKEEDEKNKVGGIVSSASSAGLKALLTGGKWLIVLGLGVVGYVVKKSMDNKGGK